MLENDVRVGWCLRQGRRGKVRLRGVQVVFAEAARTFRTVTFGVSSHDVWGVVCGCMCVCVIIIIICSCASSSVEQGAQHVRPIWSASCEGSVCRLISGSLRVCLGCHCIFVCVCVCCWIASRGFAEETKSNLVR